MSGLKGTTGPETNLYSSNICTLFVPWKYVFENIGLATSSVNT